MINVFIGGSRRITRLPSLVEARLDNIVSKGFTILVGDASGADTLVQKYLSDRNYQPLTGHAPTAFLHLRPLAALNAATPKAPTARPRSIASFRSLQSVLSEARTLIQALRREDRTGTPA